MIEKVIGFIGKGIQKINESENLKKIGTQVIGGVASCVAVHKVKQLLENKNPKKKTGNGLTEADTKETLKVIG